MKPLFFLTTRSIYNGIKRALSTPRRLIALIAVLGYWWFFLFRSFAMGRTGATTFAPSLPFPPLQILDAVVFGAFTLLTVPLILMVTQYNRTMRPADVDVLFPTPISPKVVMGFRILRDYLTSLLFPLFIALISWRSIRIDFFKNLPHPETAGYVLKTATLAWIVLAMVWTMLGYTVTLFVNRSDLQSTRNEKIVNRVVSVWILGTIAFVYFSLRADLTWSGALHTLQSPVLRIPYFVANLGTMFALGPLTGIIHSVVGGAGLIALLAFGFWLSMSQVSWMYDQAAVRGFETSESIKLQKSGDMMAIVAAAARKGKVKAGRQNFIHRLKVRGAWALVWREMVLQTRTMRSSFAFLVIIAVVYSLAPLFILPKLGQTSGERIAIGLMFVGLQAMGAFMMSSGASQTGFMEMLRRVDLLKPMPFSPSRLVTMEIIAKSLSTLVLTTFCSTVALIWRPALAPYIVSNVIATPTLAFLITCSYLVVMLLFPDIEDPSQRGIRAMMMLLGTVILCAPGVVAFAGVFFLSQNPILAALPCALINVLILLITAAWAGNLYLNFNPSE